MSTSGVSFDEALKALGKFGRYQGRVFFLMCLLAITVGAQALFTVFTLATPNFRCALPGVKNDSYSWDDPAHEELLNVSIPWVEDDDGNLERSDCELYRFRNESAPPSDLFPNRSTDNCHRWVYDHSVFKTTFIEDANLVCDKKEYHANVDMIYMVGVLFGSIIIGVISDRFGRKVALMLSVTIHVGTAVGTAFALTFAVFATLRFFLGLANMGMFLSGYVIGLEMVDNSVRTLAASVMQMFWPLGMFILDGVAYFERDWRYLQLIMSCPAALFFTYIIFVSESPRWLASKGRYDEANAIMQHAAAVNKMPPPPSIGASEIIVQNASNGKVQNEVTENVKSESPLRMFTNRGTLLITVVLFVNWVVITMIYYGLSLNVGNIAGSIYLNFFVSAIAEVVGYVVALLGLDRLGRKVMHCGCMILSGVACLSTMFPIIFDAPYTLNSMNASLNMKMDDVNDWLNKKMDAIKEEVSLLRGQYAELQEEVRQLRGEVDSLRKENQDLAKKVDDLQGRPKRNNIMGKFLAKDMAVLVLSNVGKMGASAAFSIIYLFSAELYPTVVRNSMMGASSMMARIGGIVSPYIAQLNVIVGGKLGVALPLVVFGGCGLVAGLLALLLPETLNRPLPATIDDVINLSKKDNKQTSESKDGINNKGFDQM